MRDMDLDAKVFLSVISRIAIDSVIERRLDKIFDQYSKKLTFDIV